MVAVTCVFIHRGRYLLARGMSLVDSLSASANRAQQVDLWQRWALINQTDHAGESLLHVALRGAAPGEEAERCKLIAWLLNAGAELFPGGTAVPAAKPRLPPAAPQVTRALVVAAFDASKKVAPIRGELSKAEVVAYLLADALGIEILKEEAMRLGENATKDAIAAKDGAQKLKNVVSAKKAKLRHDPDDDAWARDHGIAEFLAEEPGLRPFGMAELCRLNESEVESALKQYKPPVQSASTPSSFL